MHKLMKLGLASFITLLTGCMVGPNFRSPTAPQTSSYTELPSPVKTVQTRSVGKAGKSQYFIAGQDIPGDWWTIFHSSELNDLIIKGLNNNPNLAAAKAALQQAQQNFYAQVGASMLPTVTGQLSASRQLISGATTSGIVAPSLYNLYNASVSVTYTLDVFGGLRRQIEALSAQIDYNQFLLDAAYLTLTSNIVTTSITIASLRAQIGATHHLIQSEQNQLNIVSKQFELGSVAKSSIYSLQTQLSQLKATLPPLEQSLVQNYHALSVLVGELPSEDQLPTFNLYKLNLPTKLPISLPSLLVRQRPDIRASEALLHAASAQVGVATANLYPQFPLTASYGWEATLPSSLFKPSSLLWSFGGSLLQPVFNGGSLRAKKRAAVAAYEQAEAQYRQTVLQAFQNVADTLRALQHDAQALNSQREAEIAARKSYILTQAQFRLGGVSYLFMLTAQTQYQQTTIARIQAQAQRYADTAALFQALGGGWWNLQGAING